MQQQTYSRLSGVVRGSSSQGNEHEQRPQFATGPTMAQSDLSTIFINAPTSLTNLAQLSGISLVPIDERRTTLNLSSNNSQIISFNSQQPIITVNPRSRQNQSAIVQRAPAVTNNHVREQPSYNLNTIPSIQLLNRATSHHQRAQRVGTIPPSTVNPKPRKATTSQSQPGSVNSNSSHRTPQDSAILSRQSIDSVQISPRSADHVIIPRTSNERSISNFRATGSDSPPDDVNDNISLLRLMAIFNNPALTITPVGPTSTTAPHQIVSNSKASINAVYSSVKSGCLIEHPGSDSYPLTGNRSQFTASTNNLGVRGNPSIDAKETRYSSEDSRAVVMQSMEDNNIRTTDIGLRREDPTSISNSQHTVTLSWSPNNHNRNEILADLEQETNPSASIDSSEILEESGALTEKDNLSNLNMNESTEQECMIIARKVDFKPLREVARTKSNYHRVFSKYNDHKTTKNPIISTKRRLYVPRTEKSSIKKIKLTPCFSEVEVDTIEQDSYVSDRHYILTKIDEIAESPGLKRNMVIEPHDITIVSEEQFMSTIDTTKNELEEKFRVASQLEEDFEATSIKYEFGTQTPHINEVLILPIQLPLEEEPTEAKQEYFSLLGLVSRSKRNKIIAQQSEERLRNFSSLNEFEEFSDVDGDVRRIVDTLIQTGGDDISLRTETDIKRNELPFIEGLNRNTSRIKMTFMNALGLEKRSKRTTLYKVVKPQEVMTGNSMELKAHNDLSNTVKNNPLNQVAKTKYPLTNVSSKLALPIAKMNQAISANQMTGNGVSSINASGGSAEILRRAIKLAQASCREALHRAPNKDEYMKSLGLMAS